MNAGLSPKTAISRRSALLTLAAALAPLPASAVGRQTFKVIVAVDQHGRVRPVWIDAIRDRISEADLATVRATAKPLSAEETAWIAFVREVAPAWFKRLPQLNAPFPRVTPPRAVRIVLGNQGGDDAFGVGPDIVAFDLSSLAKAYGTDRNKALQIMPRLLSHEYTHLLINPYLAGIGWSPEWAAQDPFLLALRTLFNEGIANMRSIEGAETWVTPSGQLTAMAQDTLTKLQPILIERLRGLRADPSPDLAKTLLRNISQGPFAGKWGALPIALWLATDTGFAPEKIAGWVDKTPAGILLLAVKMADPQYQPAFQDLLASVPARVARIR